MVARKTRERKVKGSNPAAGEPWVSGAVSGICSARQITLFANGVCMSDTVKCDVCQKDNRVMVIKRCKFQLQI